VTLRYLLDTNVVSAPVAKQPDERVIRRLERDGAVCAIAAPVWHELTYTCRRLPAGKRRVALEAYLHDVVRRSFPILPYDEEAATWHGQERARLERIGRPPPYVDGRLRQSPTSMASCW
jgi:tRNA(fMet)-specific endonuclease VapC